MKTDSIAPKQIHRADYDEIVRLIPEGSSVLDLGCGDGELLLRLINEKKVKGEGVEIDEKYILQCLNKGLNVYHGNLDDGLAIYGNKSFDYVILCQTIQALHQPLFVIKEMSRVGKNAVVSLPNFAYWQVRSQLFFKGVMPKSKELPFEWYNTPNIHLCTIKDFQQLCVKENYQISETRYVDTNFGSFLPNALAKAAIFVINTQ